MTNPIIPATPPSEDIREITIKTPQGETITYRTMGQAGYWAATQEGMPDDWWLSRVASRAVDEVSRLRSDNERLKAERMEPEEAQHALDQIPDNQCGWPPEDCPVCDSLREKLRRQSDTGAHQEEKE